MSRVSVERYQQEWLAETKIRYPAVDAYVRELIDAREPHAHIDFAARVLACPVKANPACWQHGRIVFATALDYIERNKPVDGIFLDVGTAKGFSALMMQWAIIDAEDGAGAHVVSVDVIDPHERLPRNSPLDVLKDGSYATLTDVLVDFPEASAIRFLQSTGIRWLQETSERICFCFLDGKHYLPVVDAELRLLAPRQQAGDIVILDDVQIPGVAQAMGHYRSVWEFEQVEAHAEHEQPDRRHAPRTYAIGIKKEAA